mgnify:FL=1
MCQQILSEAVASLCHNNILVPKLLYLRFLNCSRTLPQEISRVCLRFGPAGMSSHTMEYWLAVKSVLDKFDIICLQTQLHAIMQTRFLF